MKKPLRILLISLFWIGVWQIIAMVIGEELLFPSPISTFRTLIRLASTADFWKNIGITFWRILAGAAAAAAAGILMGLLSGLVPFFKELFDPLMTVVRATPVASFIVLLVLWLSRTTVPMVIAFLMVVPVFYSNVIKGLENVDRQLLQMAAAFRVKRSTRIIKIYLPSLRPYIASAAASSFGLAWKAGVAAEVIVLPVISIGRRLYYASNNLETAEVFAWTAAVVILSVLMDGLVRLLSKNAGLPAGVKAAEAPQKGGAQYGDL